MNMCMSHVPCILTPAETGINPFCVLDGEHGGGSRQASYEKVIDLLVRVPWQHYPWTQRVTGQDASPGSDGRTMLQPLQVYACAHASLPGSDRQTGHSSEICACRVHA